jgi:hypothetical protein
MATRYMVANSTDWSSTASWAATSGGAGGQTVPATGDTVFIDVPCQITAGLDQSAVTLAALNISPGMSSGSFIGTSGVPFKCGIKAAGGSTGVFKWSGSGTLHYFGDGASTDVCAEFWNVTGAGKAYLVGGTFTNVYAGTSGLLTVNGATISSYLTTSGCGVYISSGSIAYLFILAGSTVVDNATCSSITVENRGVCTCRGLACHIHDVSVAPGGVIHIQCADGITESNATATVYTGGRLDASGSPYPITVDAVVRYTNAYVFDNETVPITITATTKLGYN